MDREFRPNIFPFPGQDLAEKLEELKIGPKEFAVRTGKPEKTITAILKGESSITADMAVSFETVLKIPARFWLNRQKDYDEYKAREKRKQAVTEAEQWVSSFPVKQMIKNGWLRETKTHQEKTLELFSFFGISNHKAWEDYYCNKTLKVAFSISLKTTKNPHSISAWLRKGELQAAAIDTDLFSAQAFRNILPEIKNIMAEQPDDFFSRLQQICRSVGVMLVPTPCLPGAPINGSTRWIKDNPLIQLSGRYKRNDIFWFTFFHEAAHILLHGKKNVFIEIEKYADQDHAKEDEANEFAVKWTLSEEEEKKVLENKHLTDAVIMKLAEQFNTHPGVIIGRLQHKKIIPHTVGRQFIKSIELCR